MVVSLFTTNSFDATAVDISTIRFAGASVFHSSVEDIDGDGDLDLLMHFRVEETNLYDLYAALLAGDANGDGVIDSTNQLATVGLTGETSDGNAFLGDDTMNLFLSGKALRDVLDELFS
jgi:hypothetical protein